MNRHQTHTLFPNMKSPKLILWKIYSLCLQPVCVTLHIVLHYFLLTNYSWMLCEGFYLHTVLVAAFVSEKRLVNWLILAGWTAPALVILVYGLARGLAANSENNVQ